MGQSLSSSAVCCCSSLRAKQKNSEDEDWHETEVDSSSSYIPPNENLVVDMAPIKRPNTFFISSKQDGYPPHFFKRLDQFIHDHGFRARDIFVALDSDNDKYITFEEIVSGLDRIEFKISRKEEKYLKNWMEKIVGHDLNFKEFTLALKQRAPLTSTHRVSVWGSLNSATSSNNSSKSNNNSSTSSD